MYGKAQKEQINLKSNMDRFIVSVPSESAAEYFNLKSNMDRFIVVIRYSPSLCLPLFKIQYG